MIEITPFGHTASGEPVLAFSLRDGDSYARVLNFGATLQSLVVPDRRGCPTDVVLGYRDVAAYETDPGYLGGLIGRFANRIDRGKLSVDGRTYNLACNDNGNHLHGGDRGFSHRMWAHEIHDNELVLTYFSPDGEENYPGNLSVRVIYTFRDCTLTIRYHAVSDAATAVNLTNHAYFNLNGEGQGDVHGHTLCIHSDRITPIDENTLPTGDFRAVAGTPLDFRIPKPIGRDIAADDRDMIPAKGYDHCYILDHPRGVCSTYAVAKGDVTGITMTCRTDAPAVQFYTGNYLDQQGKTGYYAPRSGFCLETQAIPNNVNVPEYAALGASLLDAGVPYTHTSMYEFRTASADHEP